MEVLVIAAHPDDEVLGLGGTIVKHCAEGDTVHLLIVTDGSTSQYKGNAQIDEIISNKIMETQKCAEILGISTIDYGGFPDMKLDTVEHVEINRCIESYIEKYRPQIVYSHFWGDVNIDHRRISESTLVAVRPVKNQCVKKLLLYRTPSSTEWNINNAKDTFMPNYFVDISNYLEQKLNAISCYKTELREYPHPRSIDAIRIIDIAAGVDVGVEAAEQFVLARELS